MTLRGVQLCHETVRLWSLRIGTDIALKMRSLRRGECHRKWNMDVTYFKVKGYDMYLYRVINKEGSLVYVYLSDTRDKKAAEAFFKSCEVTTGIHPSQVTTDK